MKKKGMASNTLGEIILTVVVAAVILALFIMPGNIQEATASTGNIKTVQQWVWQNSLEEQKTKHLFSDVGYPPVPELADAIKVNSKNIKEDSLKQDLTESIYDCGKAFYFGDPKYDFMKKWEFAEGGYTFCYTCREIDFESDVQGHSSIVGLGSYMQTHSPYPGGTPSYADILNDMNPNLFKGGIAPSQDIINSDNDNYIVFVATHDIEPTVADCAFEQGLAEKTGTVAASVIAKGINVVGIGGRYWETFTAGETYQTAIVIADAQSLKGICNPQVYQQCNAVANKDDFERGQIGTIPDEQDYQEHLEEEGVPIVA